MEGSDYVVGGSGVLLLVLLWGWGEGVMVVFIWLRVGNLLFGVYVVLIFGGCWDLLSIYLIVVGFEIII